MIGKKTSYPICWKPQKKISDCLSKEGLLEINNLKNKRFFLIQENKKLFSNSYFNFISNKVRTVPINKENVISLLIKIYLILPAENFLLYGSVAEELLRPSNKNLFNDIDIITSFQMQETGISQFAEVLNKIGVKYTNNGGNFFCYLEPGKPFQIQLIDPEHSKIAYPRSFINKRQDKFTKDQIEYAYYVDENTCFNFPCVPSEYLDSRTSSLPFYKKKLEHTNVVNISKFEI